MTDGKRFMMMWNRRNRRWTLGVLMSVGLMVLPALTLTGQEGEDVDYMKNPRRAVKDFTKKVEKNPEDPDGHYNLGLAYYHLKEYDSALPSLRKAVELKEDFPKGRYLLARAHLELQQYPEAIAQFTTVLEGLEEDEDEVLQVNALTFKAESHLFWGKAQQSQMRETTDKTRKKELAAASVENFNASLALYRELQALRPTRTDIYINMGDAYNRLGQRDKALATFRQVEQLDPENYLTHFNLGAGMMNQQLHAEATAYFQRAVDLNPKGNAQERADFADSVFLLGECLLVGGDQDQAKVRLSEYLKLAPNGTYASRANQYLGIIGK